MEPVTSYCYANEPAMVAAAMHGQTPVYPSSDAYNTHYSNYTPAMPTTYEAPYNTSQWETSQAMTYATGQQLQTTLTVSSVSSPTNPLTPPQSGSPHSMYNGHDDGNLMHHSPSGSPQSVHEATFQALSLPSITGSIHLPGKYAYYDTYYYTLWRKYIYCNITQTLYKLFL